MSDVRYEMSEKQPIRSHRDLIVWQKAMELVVSVYRESDAFPRTEVYGLTSQVRRAVVSIPANIAEGQGRGLTGEYIQFLGNARGSLLEVDTHLELATRLGFMDPNSHLALLGQLAEVRKLLSGLMRSLSSNC
jgi:four helix bundle protein